MAVSYWLLAFKNILKRGLVSSSEIKSLRDDCLVGFF